MNSRPDFDISKWPWASNLTSPDFGLLGCKMIVERKSPAEGLPFKAIFRKFAHKSFLSTSCATSIP